VLLIEVRRLTERRCDRIVRTGVLPYRCEAPAARVTRGQTRLVAPMNLRRSVSARRLMGVYSVFSHAAMSSGCCSSARLIGFCVDAIAPTRVDGPRGPSLRTLIVPPTLSRFEGR
jgi:hypothetical protein